MPRFSLENYALYVLLLKNNLKKFIMFLSSQPYVDSFVAFVARFLKFALTILGHNALMMMMMMMMMMIMMNCFCGMVDWQNTFGFISSQYHFQRFSPSQNSDLPPAGFEPVQNLSSGFDKWNCAVVITTTTPHHKLRG